MKETDFIQDIKFGNKKIYLISGITEIISESIGNLAKLEQAMMQIVSSKINHAKIVIDPENSIGKVVCIVAKDAATVSNIDDGVSYDIMFGDIVLASGDAAISISGNCTAFDFYISDSPKVFGTGSRKFEVSATINDKYVISVNADNEEQAIEIANKISIDNWEHPTIEPHLKERKIVRYARWGNLSATEVQ